MPPISFKNLLSGPESDKSETVKIEKDIYVSLISYFPGERKKAEAKVLKIAETEPKQMVALLLRYYNDDQDERNQEILRDILREISKTDTGKEAIVDGVSNPNRDVRRGVKKIIGNLWGPQAVPYASLYEQTIVLIGFARKRDVPVDDIEKLASISQRTFLEGEIVRAIKDISHCMDLIKLRYRNVENLKNYLSEMLRTIPELNKLGVSTTKIEQSLKTALTISRNRQFEYTQELFDDRTRELEIRDELFSIGQIVKGAMKQRPEMKLADLNGMDVWAFEKMGELVQSSMASNLVGTRTRSLKDLHEFLVNEFNLYYEANARERIEREDLSALFTVYLIGIISLKIMAELVPVVAEEIYQNYFREMEREPSILMVMWPEVVIRMAK